MFTAFRRTASALAVLTLTAVGANADGHGHGATGNDQAAVIDVSASDLLGTWDVALYFSPTAPPSSTVMEVTAVNEDGTFEGTFYGTTFDIARHTSRDGNVAFTVITTDNSGYYATSGRLSEPDLIEGQTLATGRDFIMMWSAKRRD